MADRGQWIAQLVPQQGQEFVLAMVGFPQCRFCSLSFHDLGLQLPVELLPGARQQASVVRRRREGGKAFEQPLVFAIKLERGVVCHHPDRADSPLADMR